MWEWLSPERFMPHGHCYLWTPGLVWLQATSNAAIGSAYLVISGILWYLVRRIEDVPFRWMYVCFGVFIVTCGLTHYFDVLTVWRPVYWVDGGMRSVTAIASVGTAILLIPLVPKAIALGQAARVAHERGLELEALNRELAVLYARTRETLAETIPQLVWTNEPDGSPDYFNARWFEYLGDQSRADLSFDAVHPDDASTFHESFRAALRSGAVFEAECRLQRHDGEYRWHLARALPVREGQRIVKWFGTFTDIDEHKRAAEAREQALHAVQVALSEREVFLTVAAHELRTPLTPLRLQLERIHGNLQTSARPTQPAIEDERQPHLDPERLRTMVGTSLRQVDRLETLVGSILDVSRIASGQFELHRAETDLSDLVEAVALRHRAEITRQCGELRLDVQRGVRVDCDPSRVDQALTNLLTNAVKFCSGSPIQVRLTQTDVAALVTVRDEGSGIAPDDLQRIFDRFERGVSHRHYGGLGLGLWISSKIAEAHGGKISVESAVGKGSSFTIELPLGPRP